MQTDKVPARLLAGLGLGLLGFIANWFKLEIFFSVDFLAGSIFVMLAILWPGGIYGILAGFVAAVSTCFLWNHPWAVFVMGGEALFVTGLLRKRVKNLLICDMIYWFVLGAPLIFMTYHGIMGVQLEPTALIMLKQSINGIFNALIASIVYSLLDAYVIRRSVLTPYKDLLFTVMVSLVVLPALVLLGAELRQELKEQNRALCEEVSHRSEIACESLTFWVLEHRHSVETLARLIGDPDTTPTAQKQRLLEVIKSASPAFLRMGVMNRQSVTIAYSPLSDETGISTLGVDLSDRPYVPIIQNTLRPYVSDVLVGRMNPVTPILPLVVPLVSAGEYKGFCSGVVDLSRVSRMLSVLAGGSRVSITVLDRNRRVVATTRNDLKVMEAFQRPSGSMDRLDEKGISHWIPATKVGESRMQRWRQSLLVKEQTLSPDLSWTVIVEGSLLPILNSLIQRSILSLLVSILLTVFTVVVAYVASQKLTRRLEELREVTNALPTHLSDTSRIHWPESKISEVHQLVGKFRQMAGALSASFQEQKVLNDRLNDAQRISRIGSWELDLLTDGLACSDELYRIYEIDPLQVRPSYELFQAAVHPEDRSLVRQAHVSSIRSEACFDIEYRLLMPDGRIKYVQERSEPFFAADGTVQRYLVTVQDVTEIRLAEEALRASEEKFRILFDHAADAIFIHDPEGRFLAVNETACERLGYGREEFLGKSIEEIQVPGSPELFSRREGESCAFDRAVLETALVTRDVRSIPVELHCRSLSFEGRPAIMTMARDITVRKQAEEAILASLHEKEILLREIHHRVKNNLQVISSLLSLQAGKVDDRKTKQVLQESQQRIRTMAMIHETLYGGRNLATIDLALYLKNLVDHLREVFGGRTGVRIVVEAADIRLSVDQAVACGLIINELVTNAFKYAFPSAGEGLIRVRACAVGEEEVELMVSDNGAGLPRALDFQQISSLGLQLVRGLVEHQLAGSWEMNTKEGTTFTIRWHLV